MCTDLENGYARHMQALTPAELSSDPDYLGPNLDDHNLQHTCNKLSTSQ